MIPKCESCRLPKPQLKTAYVHGKYYRHICLSCLGETTINSNAAGYDRRRQYEDYAQDTVQPYTASGPNVEFLRLYPRQAEKIFTKDDLAKLKRLI